jgi:hypothetical protein
MTGYADIAARCSSPIIDSGEDVATYAATETSSARHTFFF